MDWLGIRLAKDKEVDSANSHERVCLGTQHQYLLVIHIDTRSDRTVLTSDACRATSEAMKRRSADLRGPVCWIAP